MSDRLDQIGRMLLELAFDAPLRTSAEAESLWRIKLPEVASCVAELSTIYTRDRIRLKRDLLENPRFRKAYLLYFLPCNMMKVPLVLEEIARLDEGRARLGGNLRVLDIGSGPGTHLLGLLEFLASRPPQPPGLPTETRRLDCVALDAVERNLSDLRRLFHRYHQLVGESGGSPLLRGIRTVLDRALPATLGKFDVVLMGNVLNELFVESEDPIARRAAFVSDVAARFLRSDGFLIVMEPALKETSRDLLKVRNRLLMTTQLRVFSPCVHNLPCPAVSGTNLDDWCHEERPWSVPDFIARIDTLIGNRKSSLKFAYVVLSPTGWSICHAAGDRETSLSDSSSVTAEAERWRVVSDRLEEKGKSSVFLCGRQGRFKVSRLQKHNAQSNADFGWTARGCVVETTDLRMRTEREWRVERSAAFRILQLPTSGQSDGTSKRGGGN
ncbi:MAG: small ribosomal subunit Rsm22 family protein [Acidobacteriota bacterium]